MEGAFVDMVISEKKHPVLLGSVITLLEIPILHVLEFIKIGCVKYEVLCMLVVLGTR